MSQRKPYDQLALIPSVIAETVVTSVYRGTEQSMKIRDARFVMEVEAKRKALTKEQVALFVSQCDKRCRDAYAVKADWFMKCVRSRSNRGRDQLYTWIQHWLSAFVFKGDLNARE